MIIDLDKITAESLAPLEGENPAGENVRYETDYEEAQNEIRKLTALAAGEEGVNWETIIKNCSRLLAQRTKDFNLAAYLSLALLKEDGYAGLAAGLDIINGYMGDLWESAYPPIKRMKARANVFQWLDERISEAVGVDEPGEDQAEAVRRCLAAAQDLAKLVGEKVDVPVTGLSDLRGALQKWADAFPEPEPEPEPELEPEPEEDAGGEEGGAETVAAPAKRAGSEAPRQAAFSAPEKMDSAEDALDALTVIVNQMRSLSPASALPYRLARVIKWEELSEEPQADASGRSQVPGPRDDEAEPLAIMAGASNWTDLAEEAESRFLEPVGTFWLDLQRLVAQALEGQGCQEAAQAVAREAGALAARLPGLAGLSFADGRPFADAATQQWLEEAKSKAAPQGAAAADPDLGAPWRKDALAKASQGDLAGGLVVMQKAVAQAPGHKPSLKRRLMAADLCLSYGRPAWAAPILEALASEVKNITLKEWAPEFYASIWGGLVRAYQGMTDEYEQPDEEQEKRLEQARRELFETDLALAAKLSQPDE